MTDLSDPPLSAPEHAPLEACLQCAAPLATDQRWCLQCGRRREGVGSPFPPSVLGEPAREPVAFTAPALRAPDQTPRWLYGVLGFGVAAILFALGLIVGASGHNRRTLVNLPAQPAPVVNVTVPAGSGAAPTAADATASFTSDWPDGKDGWTVQLSKLPTDGTDTAAVTATKTAASDQGAGDVGALLSDDYASLPAGRYIVYSGVFKAKAKATAALAKLRKDFPKAKVIRVSASGDDSEPVVQAPKDSEKLSPDDFQKQSKKLPDKVGTGGKAPPTDSKPAGGGSKAETFG